METIKVGKIYGIVELKEPPLVIFFEPPTLMWKRCLRRVIIWIGS